MTSVFGLYFGNSTASIAVCKDDGRIDILANEAGDRVTLATLYVTSSEQVVGLPSAGNISKAASTITRNKSLLDSRLSDEGFAELKKTTSVQIDRDEDGSFTYHIPDENDGFITYTPEQVATFIFKKLYGIGASNSGGGTLRCVITVPQDWDKELREATVAAANEAGWQVMQVVNEPTAALLAYDNSQETKVNMTALVYRLGGHSCEATVIKVRDGFYSIVGSQKGAIGTRAVIDVVVKHLASLFRMKTKLEPEDSRKCMSKLWAASENLIRTLSTLPTASFYLESLCEGVDYSASLSRARLDSLLASLLPEFVIPLLDVLKNNSLTPSDVDKVVYCGGGLNIGKIREYIGSHFPPETESCDSLSTQEVTAIGAARQAGLLAAAFPNRLPQELSLRNHSLSIITEPIHVKLNSDKEVFIEGVLPCSKSQELAIKDSSPLDVMISQGEHFSTKVEVESFDSTPSSVQVNVNISGDSANKIEIEACDVGNNQSKSIVLNVTPIEVK